MLRNIDSRFSQAPLELDLPRSRFDRSFDHKTTFNAGDLVPIFLDEVLPGDTFDMRTAYTARMSTPIFPVMDNAYLETFFFFVPTRLLWEHWKEFNGENNSSYWTQPVEYNVPQLAFPLVDKGGFSKGSVADYFGLPVGVGRDPQKIEEASGFSVSALPFRGYCQIFNDWFRDQNVMQPAYFPTDDSDREGVAVDEDTDARTSAYLGGKLLKVSKYHDYFTSALPETQKGNPVAVGASGAVTQFPVVTGAFHGLMRDDLLVSSNISQDNVRKLEVFGLETINGDNVEPVNGGVLVDSFNSEESAGGSGDYESVGFQNLYADASASGLNLNILVNDIRLGFQLQKLLERDARSGTRYIEAIKAHFGVDSPDGRLQRSEYLGGSRQPININQVLQTSGTTQSSPLGSTAAYSLTNSVDNSFIKSFTEHGYVIGLACVRTDHTYQQGINKMWSRKRRFDYYWPSLAHIGEQAILKKELVAVGDDAERNEEAFGYQEAWAEYRYKPSQVTGAFRSGISGSLDAWHYADYFDPEKDFVVSEEFISETPVNVDRTLAVQSDLEDQFIADFYFDCKVTRVMPLYSVPGLVDHY